MEFYQWSTEWDFHCRTHKKEDRLTEKQFFHRYAKKALNTNLNSIHDNRVVAEIQWSSHGRPYYCVHPAIVDKLIGINLRQVPAYLVETPRGFPAVVIRFCEKSPSLTLTSQQRQGEHIVPAGSFVHSILMEKDEQNKNIILLVDFGLKDSTFSLFVFHWQSETETLQDCIERLENKLSKGSPLGPAYAKVMANCCRLAVTIGFLANSNDELVEYDVLSKYKNQFSRSDEDKKQHLIMKSKRAGKLGWNIGNDIMFLGALPTQNQHKQTGNQRGELRWAHIRQGHPHAVRYGPNHNLVKVMWFRPTTVRADLPFKK